MENITRILMVSPTTPREAFYIDTGLHNIELTIKRTE